MPIFPETQRSSYRSSSSSSDFNPLAQPFSPTPIRYVPGALVIRNISFDVKKSALSWLLVSMRLPKPTGFNYLFLPEDGLFRGTAFVNFRTPEEAFAVRSRLNGFQLAGRYLNVEYKRDPCPVNGPCCCLGSSVSMEPPSRRVFGSPLEPQNLGSMKQCVETIDRWHERRGSAPSVRVWHQAQKRWVCGYYTQTKMYHGESSAESVDFMGQVLSQDFTEQLEAQQAASVLTIPALMKENEMDEALFDTPPRLSSSTPPSSSSDSHESVPVTRKNSPPTPLKSRCNPRLAFKSDWKYYHVMCWCSGMIERYNCYEVCRSIPEIEQLWPSNNWVITEEHVVTAYDKVLELEKEKKYQRIN